MLNLAPIRYANILAERGGPVEKVERISIRIGGEPVEHAGAVLTGRFRTGKALREVFGGADGAGTDASPLLARYKAISEAMERWAFHECYSTGRGADCGLDIDPTSSGMAAYPGLFKRQARQQAWREAVERWALVEWWAGRIGHERVDFHWSGIRGIRLKLSVGKLEMVIIWRQLEEGCRCYGYSAASDLKRASRRALIELDHCAVVLENFRRQQPRFDMDQLKGMENELERRVVYFSLPDGQEAFDDRLKWPYPDRTIPLPAPVFDREVGGPWSRYATVWRIIFPTSDRRHHDPDALTFFW